MLKCKVIRPAGEQVDGGDYTLQVLKRWFKVTSCIPSFVAYRSGVNGWDKRTIPIEKRSETKYYIPQVANGGVYEIEVLVQQKKYKEVEVKKLKDIDFINNSLWLPAIKAARYRRQKGMGIVGYGENPIGITFENYVRMKIYQPKTGIVYMLYVDEFPALREVFLWGYEK